VASRRGKDYKKKSGKLGVEGGARQIGGNRNQQGTIGARGGEQRTHKKGGGGDPLWWVQK